MQQELLHNQLCEQATSANLFNFSDWFQVSGVFIVQHMEVVCREDRDSKVSSYSGKGSLSGIPENLPFLILDETSKSFPTLMQPDLVFS